MGNDCCFRLAQSVFFKKGYEAIKEVDTNGQGFFGLEANDIDGTLVKFSEFKNKNINAFLIVNVATN